MYNLFLLLCHFDCNVLMLHSNFRIQASLKALNICQGNISNYILHFELGYFKEVLISMCNLYPHLCLSCNNDFKLLRNFKALAN